MNVQKSRYPLGFYIITLVGDSDRACSGEEGEGQGQGEGVAGEEEADWLWQAAVFNESAPVAAAGAGAAPPRVKLLSFEIKVE